MKQSRFSEEQIIGFLKQNEAGVPATQLCREQGISESTFYKWKSRFGGMDVSEAKRLRQLEDAALYIAQQQQHQLSQRTAVAFTATGVFSGGTADLHAALSKSAGGRSGFAPAPQGIGAGTIALWLSTPASRPQGTRVATRSLEGQS